METSMLGACVVLAYVLVTVVDCFNGTLIGLAINLRGGLETGGLETGGLVAPPPVVVPPPVPVVVPPPPPPPVVPCCKFAGMPDKPLVSLAPGCDGLDDLPCKYRAIAITPITAPTMNTLSGVFAFFHSSVMSPNMEPEAWTLTLSAIIYPPYLCLIKHRISYKGHFAWVNWLVYTGLSLFD